jgi:hypothetical protein
MASTIKNTEGCVVAYIEWQILDAAGFQVNNSDYIYIKNMWIHPDWRDSRAFRNVIDKIYKHPYSQNAGFVYWEIFRDSDGVKMTEENDREFSTRRMSKIFNKKYIVNKILQGDVNVLRKFKETILAN